MVGFGFAAFTVRGVYARAGAKAVTSIPQVRNYRRLLHFGQRSLAAASAPLPKFVIHGSTL
jgi:hypothetical protein